MPKAELHIHIEGVLGTVRYLLGEFDLKEPLRAFEAV